MAKKIISQLEIILIALFFLFSLVLFEPALRHKLSFAITSFDNPKIAQGTLPDNQQSQLEKVQAQTKQEKSRAPEPGTLFFFVSGLGGIIVRFARKRFEEFKRACDVILSVFGLIIAAPLLASVGIVIKLSSSGPVIYRQNRVGKRGKIFRIYKLRTMRVDAETATGAVWARKNDPRITPIGRFLRKTHIDEIPQLLNVLNGEMSIVGPRPERPELVRDLKEVICDYEKRLLVKPGITGLAQVWHKYDESIKDVKKKIKYDCLYIKKMCLLVDLRILAHTCLVVVTGKGAR
ncbi:MAG: sugar transferase [Candidatus Omnitrophica bacterium]|nr:sugar transferase [Candidatus Omnitrophota bacterium]